MNKNNLPHIGTLLIALSVIGLLTAHVLFSRQIANTRHRIVELETVTQHARDDLLQAELVRQNVKGKMAVVSQLESSALYSRQIQSQLRVAIRHALSSVQSERVDGLVDALQDVVDYEKLDAMCDRYLAEGRKHVHTIETRLGEYRKHLVTLESQKSMWLIGFVVLQAIGLTFALVSSYWS